MKKRSTVSKGKHTRSPTEQPALSLGDVVSAAFDQAYEVTKNQQQAAALASVVVQRLLGRQARGLYMKRFAVA
ncbi:MAG: hypothetical protein SF187_26275 [Deltaproteobacteria bacterium]|nr:hypothetical protein [Deltaproteobacteria bacterium]